MSSTSPSLQTEEFAHHEKGRKRARGAAFGDKGDISLPELGR